MLGWNGLKSPPAGNNPKTDCNNDEACWHHHRIMLHHQKPINTTQIALTAGFVGSLLKL